MQTVTRFGKPKTGVHMTIGTEEVQHRAYLIWESEGRPDGRAFEHWVQAETELAKERADAPEAAAPVKVNSKKSS
jgi:hypothetical protein